MILSSKITTKHANTGKKDKLALFIADYRDAVEFYVDYIWNNSGITKQDFKLNKFAPKAFPPNTPLLSRALKCASAQALGCVKSRIRKIAKTQYVIKRDQKAGKPIGHLQSKYDKLLAQLKKPTADLVYPELCSICCNFKKKKTTEFDGVIVLSCIGEKYGKISIPVKFTKHSNHLAELGRQMTSFLVTEDGVHFRYNIVVGKKKKGKTEGADQGITTCLTVSDGQVTKKCIHGHDLRSIIGKIARKQKGSKAFAAAQEHRTNYVNWSIKQLNLSNIKQLNLEKLRGVGKGQRKSRRLQAFAYKEIRTALVKTCELNGVRLTEGSNAYRSQRCNQCGFVHKSNRRGEMFKCKSCGHTANADLNAAMNHRDKLCDLPSRFRHLPNRTSGFFWKSRGLFAVDGVVLTVPLA